MAAHMGEQRRGDGCADTQHDRKSREQGEAEQRGRDGPEEPIVVFVRVGVRKQRRKQQSLGDDLGIRVARIPCLNDVYAKQASCRGRRNWSDQAASCEVHRENAQNRPPRNDTPSARDTIQSVRDGDPHGIALRKLSRHRASVGIAQMKSHEANAVIIRITV